MRVVDGRGGELDDAAVPQIGRKVFLRGPPLEAVQTPADQNGVVVVVLEVGGRVLWIKAASASKDLFHLSSGTLQRLKKHSVDKQKK